MADGKVIIEIDAEDSGFLNTLRSMGSAAESLTSGSLKNLEDFLRENGITAEAWSRMLYNATTTVVNSFSALDTSLGMDLKSMASNLSENILAYNSWNTNLETLMAAAVRTGSDAAVQFVLYMQEMGIGAANQVQQMVDNIDYTMDTFPPLMAQAVEAGMNGIYTQVENGKAGITTAAEGLMDGAVSAIAGADLQGAAATAGAGIPPGLKNQMGAVTAAGQAMITGLTGLWTAAVGRFRTAGQLAGQGFGSGLLSGKATLTATASSLAEGVASAFSGASGSYRAAGLSAAQNLAGGLAAGSGGIASSAALAALSAYSTVQGLGWYGLGYNISSGIASGVRAGSGLITSAARSAASAALSSAKKALDIHSPSRVFQDEVGRMIPSGIALGIERSTPEAQTAVTLSADRLLHSAQAAVSPQVDDTARSYVTQNTIYQNAARETLQVTVPLTVDGREFARATAKYTGRQMAYLEV